jgi:O-antigen/teichoic acid export membrane protein
MNDGALEHRAARVSLANGISTILAVAIQLISVPVCLRYWGKESYGTWLALQSAYLLLRGLDSGYGAYVGNKLNYLYHQNISAMRAHLSSAVFGIVIIGVLQLALAAGTLIFGPLSAALGISEDQAGGLAAKLGLLALMTSWALTGSYLGIVSRLMIPAGLMYQSAWWAMAFPVFQFAAVIASALLRLNMLETSLLFALAQTAVSVATALYVRGALPRFSPWLNGATTRVGLSDLRHSLFLTTSNLIQQGATNGSVLLISFMSGPIAVSMFTTVRTLTTVWISVTAILSGPLLPDVVRLHATGEVEKLVAINKAYWVLAGSAVNLGAILSYPLIPFIYDRWTAHAVALDQPLLCLLLCSVLVSNAGALMALHLNGINSLRIILAASAARAILGLGGGALGFKYYGLTSFGLGILAGEIAATLVTARHFVEYEIRAKGSRMPASDFGPVSLSTGAVLLFFIGASFGWWSVGWAWILAVLCAAIASVLGWNTLEPALRTRLKGIPGKLFRL